MIRTNLQADLLLLALAHAPGIPTELQSQVVGDSVGHYVPDATVYRLLSRLVADGYVDQNGTEYTLTDKGAMRVRHNGKLWRRLSLLAEERLH
jgi:DNA-binding PadR family transcriptional regulator